MKSSQEAKWCWTKSMINEPSFVLDQSKGGMNWGFCSQEESIKQKYVAIVETSILPNSATKYLKFNI